MTNPIKNYQIPSTYHLGESGCGCAGEPPSHPRYYIRPIYTSHGNSPAYNRPQYYLNGNGYFDIEQVDKLFGTEKFPKLPLNHPRTRAWIEDKYRHHQHCYYHPTEKEYNRPKTVIFPVPIYELKTFRDDVRFSNEWREKEKIAIEVYNNEIIKERTKFAIPENHSAVVLIKRYYPEYEPELDLIENPPKTIETWWETYSEKPTPETCKGSRGLGKHPVNNTWCQVCGWHKEENKGY